MSAREWVSLLFRLLAIYFLVGFVVSLSGLVMGLVGTVGSLAFEHVEVWMYALTIAATLLQGILGYAMLVKTDWFVDRALRGVLVGQEKREREIERERELGGDVMVEEPEAQAGLAAGEPNSEATSDSSWVIDLPSLSRDDVFSLVVSILGVWLLVSALPSLAQIVVNMIRLARTLDATQTVGEYVMSTIFDPRGSLLAWLLQVILGTWMFLSPFGIVRFWSRRQRRIPATE